MAFNEALLISSEWLFSAAFNFLAYQTGVSVSLIHAGNFIWHGGFQMSRVLYNGTVRMTSWAGHLGTDIPIRTAKYDRYYYSS
jgi:hypothetical protein